jgi:voltage-gated potassium channel
MLPQLAERGHPAYAPDVDGPESMWRRVRWLTLLVVATLTYGVIGYMTIERWPFLDALYMTVITLTTVGFREVRPLDTSGQVFTMTVMVTGVGLVLITLGVTAQWVLESRWREHNRTRRMQRRIDAMGDHVIVCAYGRVGRAIAREFEASATPYVVVDPKLELAERMDEDGVWPTSSTTHRRRTS